MRGQNAKPIPSELYNASKNGFVTSAEQVKDYKIGMSQEDINQFFLHKRTKHVTVTATPETTSVEQLLPPVGDEDTIYRVGSWDGDANEYNPNKHSEYGWNSSGDNPGYILLSVEDYGIDDEPTPGSTNTVTSGGVAAVEGYYEENPEYLRVYLDAEGRIIKGIREDGTQYFAAGVATDASETYASENPEYLKVYLDKEGHILWAIESDGNILYGVGIPRQIKEYVSSSIKPFEQLLHFEDSPEYVDVKLDAEDKITEATRINGAKVLPAGAEFGGNVIKGLNNPEYLEITTDAKNKIISSIDAELEDIKYGGINLSEMKRDADCDVLQCGYDADRLDIYTIENNDSTITMEVDDDLNVYEVKDSHHTAELIMEDNGEVYLEQTIKEI